METKSSKKGKLFIVSTPIGNKDDISIRALNVLKICDLVVCEEIKEGAQLLKQYNLLKDLESLNEQNEIEQSLVILDKLENGEKIALVSDCGTPLFADPGQHLVRGAIKADIAIEVIPGASSLMTALVRSGLDLSSFLYAGFLSRKYDERLDELKALSKERRTVVLLETPYRFSALLEAAANIMPNRSAYIGMNLSMPYETHHYGTFKELFEKFNDENVKAEFVVCFEGSSDTNVFSKAADRLYSEPNYSRERRPDSRDRDSARRPRSNDKVFKQRKFGDDARSNDNQFDKSRGDRFRENKYAKEDSFKPKKKFDDRPPRRKFDSDDRPPRRKFDSDDRPPRRKFDGDDRPPRRNFDSDDRPPRRKFDSDDRPPRRKFDSDGGGKKDSFRGKSNKFDNKKGSDKRFSKPFKSRGKDNR